MLKKIFALALISLLLCAFACESTQPEKQSLLPFEDTLDALLSDTHNLQDDTAQTETTPNEWMPEIDLDEFSRFLTQCDESIVDESIVKEAILDYDKNARDLGVIRTIDPDDPYNNLYGSDPIYYYGIVSKNRTYLGLEGDLLYIFITHGPRFQIYCGFYSYDLSFEQFREFTEYIGNLTANEMKITAYTDPYIEIRNEIYKYDFIEIDSVFEILAERHKENNTYREYSSDLHQADRFFSSLEINISDINELLDIYGIEDESAPVNNPTMYIKLSNLSSELFPVNVVQWSGIEAYAEAENGLTINPDNDGKTSNRLLIQFWFN